MSRLRIATALAAVLVGAAPGTATAAPATAAPIRPAIGTVLPGSYLVVLRPAADPQRAVAAAATLGGRIGHRYQAALRGFEVSLTEAAARRLAAHPAVAYLERNATVQVTAPPADGTGATAPDTAGTTGDVSALATPWNLDRIDQNYLPLNGVYAPTYNGTGVRAYVMGTGVRMTHTDFGGRAISGRDVIDNDNDSSDCNGLSTHLAGTVGGATYGAAKRVTLVAVRNVNCSGSATIAQILASIDWVTANAVKPAVVLLPVGSSINTTMETAVKASIASGLTYVVTAGSSGGSACNYTPSRIPEAITVSTTDSTDTRASFANYGSCVDLFAPGVNIVSDWWTNDTATNMISGTSTSAALATGAVALLLQAHPTWTPAQISAVLNATATTGVVINPGAGSPNRLLYVD